MPARALWTGIFLILIATFGIMASQPSPTALIPGVLGTLIALLGIVSNHNENIRGSAMLAALGLALLGMVVSLPSIPDFITLLIGGQVERPVATMTQFATVFICLAFAVRWLLERRKA